MIDDFAKILHHGKSVHASFRVIEARDLLAGRVSLKSVYGTGMLNKICVKDGLLLDENIKVLFPKSNTLFFHKRDKLHIDAVKELVVNKYDSLTSYGLCSKPIYSKPSGFINESGKAENIIYTFDLSNILDGSAALPYYLYINAPDGTKLPDAVPILARRINIHIYKDVYMQFRPNIISVPEIIEICKQRYEEYKPNILNTHWGVKSDDLVQQASGLFKRRLKGIEFELINLLEYKAFLPIEIRDGIHYLYDDIIIIVSNTQYYIKKNIAVQHLWDRWKPIGPDRACQPDCIRNSTCVIDYDEFITSKKQLPSVKGLVTSMNIVIKFDESSVLCYNKNVLIQEVLWELHRIHRSNNPLDNNYKILNVEKNKRVKVEKVYHTFYKLLDDFEDEIITRNCVLIIDPCCLSVPIPSGTTKRYAESIYMDRQKEFNGRKKKELIRYRMWVKK